MVIFKNIYIVVFITESSPEEFSLSYRIPMYSLVFQDK